MLYSILTLEGALGELFKANKSSLGLQEIFGNTEKSVEWLLKSPDNTMIIYMPFEQQERDAIIGSHSKVIQNCIGLDPAITSHSSSTKFRKTHPADIRIISQVRHIISTNE